MADENRLTDDLLERDFLMQDPVTAQAILEEDRLEREIFFRHILRDFREADTSDAELDARVNAIGRIKNRLMIGGRNRLEDREWDYCFSKRIFWRQDYLTSLELTVPCDYYNDFWDEEEEEEEEFEVINAGRAEVERLEREKVAAAKKEAIVIVTAAAIERRKERAWLFSLANGAIIKKAA